VRISPLFTITIASFFLYAEAGVWIRINQAGYTPERNKTAIILSDTDIAGKIWSLKKNDSTVLSGKIPAGESGDNIYTAQAFIYAIDFSALKEKGSYAFEVPDAQTQQVLIKDDPYSIFAKQALMHLRAMRSRHLGDSAAIAYKVEDNWRYGAWQEAKPRRTIDMQGGHYDAGDYIKFTLNEAYLAWHLLNAYIENPSLPDILDEAKYSLDYLLKTFPDENTFVIQVGDGKDHEQGWRLPEMDALNGKRPALCALSRAHMGSTAAALALGANVFKNIDAKAAAKYREKAKAIYDRATQSDTQASAFEHHATNDFYYDQTDEDNMALAAAELGEESAYVAPAAGEVSWSEWNAFANYRLAEQGDKAAKSRFLLEASRYEWENIWNLPGEYMWGSLHRWIGKANVHFRAQRLQGKELSLTFWGVLDYVFGRNNWGIAMLASNDLPYSIRNVYNGIYRLTKVFPTGALSEGPGDKATHLKMQKYFAIPKNNSFEKFNTEVGVFYDNADDFMIQESTIGGQGDLLLMLALASRQK